MRRGRIHLGTSGWNYLSWRDDFYQGKPQRALTLQELLRPGASRA
jgi:uncharacterized protein YecE (DUF72 family)